MATIIYRKSDLVLVGTVPSNMTVEQEIALNVIPYFGGTSIDYDSIETNETNFHLENIEGAVTVVVNQPTLAEVQRAKIAEVTAAYQAELNDKFSSSATGKELDYDYRLVNAFGQNSQDLWKELKDTIGTAVDEGILPDSVLFPDNDAMDITIRDNSRVPHTRDQLYQVFRDIATHKLTLYTKWQKLVTADGSIMMATDIDAVKEINW